MQTEPLIHPYKQIVVCATQRSGSTMICEDLTNAGLGRPEEWFLSWNPEARMNWAAELETVKARGTTPNGIFAAKLMADQLRNVDACLSGFTAPETSGPYPHLRSLFRNAIWVWVRRQDTVDQAISHYMAQKRGFYHAVSRTSGFVPGSAVTIDRLDERDTEVAYDFEAIHSEWAKIERDNLIWRYFFDRTGISPLLIWYEYAPENAALTVAPYFEVTVDPKPRNLVKLPSRRNDDLKSRFLADLFAA